MRRGQPVSITIDGRPLAVSYLGRGQFTTAYRAEQTVYLFTDDAGKEAVGMLHSYKNPHIPRMLHLESQGRDQEIQVYQSRFYQRLRAANKEAWRHYQALVRMLGKALAVTEQEMGYRCFDLVRDAARVNARLTTLVEESDLPETLKEAIADLTTQAANYGESMYYEFQVRNLAVDAEGNLILLDVLFDTQRVRAEHERRVALSRITFNEFLSSGVAHDGYSHHHPDGGSR